MIHFFSEDIDFAIKDKTLLRKWIVQTIRSHQCKPGDINYIFCTDEYLRRVNVEYLQHDYYTDIITFDNSEEDGVIQSDIYISIDRIRDNAAAIGAHFNDELHRVMIHGILHLLGHDDHNEQDIARMRQAENQALLQLQQLRKPQKPD